MGRLAGAVLSSPAAIPSASVLLVRDEPFEVLMLHRHAGNSFAPGAWVFPGGATEPRDEELARSYADGSTLAAMRLTAARETFEETGVWLGAPLGDAGEKREALLRGEIAFGTILAEAPLDPERLVWTSRWITPLGLPKRFDTWFFVVAVARDTVATAEQREAVDVVWIAPSAALARRAEMKLLFPTMRNLEAIVPCHGSRELIESRRGAVIEPVQPVLVAGKPTLPCTSAHSPPRIPARSPSTARGPGSSAPPP